MREYIATKLLLLPLNEVDVSKHPFRLEARRKFGGSSCVQMQTRKRDELEDETLLAKVPHKVLQVIVYSPNCAQETIVSASQFMRH